MPTTYCVSHPDKRVVFTATSPQGVADLVRADEGLSPGRYEIVELPSGSSQPGYADRSWGFAVKDEDGDVYLEPADETP